MTVFICLEAAPEKSSVARFISQKSHIVWEISVKIMPIPYNLHGLSNHVNSLHFFFFGFW